VRCCSLIRTGQHYRADIFAEGLRRHGYLMEPKWQRRPNPDDLLLLWNRTRGFEAVAQIYENHGARVLVAENGYLPPAGGGKHYALALSSHNGAGRWFVGERARFEISEQPWRTSGSKVLILPQRGIGQPGVAMPGNWPGTTLKRLGRLTNRELILRPHPGHQRVSPPLDFDDIWCAVTWGSGAALKALQAGIPVFYDLPEWIGGCAAARLADSVESCQIESREQLWTRISWAQWTLDEIASGEALDRLLNEEDRSLFRAGEQPVRPDSEGDGQGPRTCWSQRVPAFQLQPSPGPA
jgi:hypothetical protein